ncbi:MAG: glycoside hydrolase family 2 protein, partial [Bacteroidales bacterium]|nr:glycoside hydrolase family 2 protein [Bacteroidales bacterium]
RRVTEERADLMAEVHLLSKSGYKGCEVTVALLDAEGNTVISKTTPYINNDQAIINLAIDRPHLWNGTADPYLYTLVTTLSRNGKEIDRVEEQTGFRYFWVDADKGFFLNGKHIRLRGVSRHQEWKDVSAALTREHHLADYDLMSEMGINALRLAHYPQAHFMFEEADRRGILVWEEIPFICNYIKDSMDENLRFQLREMIIQNFNHPSIFCWGLFNEVPDDHCSMTAELNDIAHTLDPSRLTTAATCFEGDFNFITDLMGWNKYAGWYYGTFSDFATIFDTWHAEHPDVKLCISEYGAGAAISQHVGRYRESDGSDARESARGHWHPMEKQTASHMAHIRMIEERPYLWGTFVWNMFDFASSMRREGDTNNMNDKGLVSHDRKVRKDAFYAYKAYWNKNEKTVHLCSKDYTLRKEALCDIIVFTTAPSVKLYINGKLVGTQKTDAFATAQWRDFTLQKGENRVEVRTAHGNDSATWIVE